MAGTLQGGKNAAKTNKEKYGDDFYKRIGAIGGARGNSGGFAHRRTHTCDTLAGEHTVAQCAGFKGGRISRRGKADDTTRKT